MAFGVIFAPSGAIGPIVGQNYGAGRMDRVKRAFYGGLAFTALVIVGVSLLLFVLRGPIADLFSATDVTRQLVFLLCGPLSLAFFFNGGDLRLECRAQQSGASVLVNDHQLGAAYRRNGAVFLGVWCALWRTRLTDRTGGGRCHLCCAWPSGWHCG